MPPARGSLVDCGEVLGCAVALSSQNQQLIDELLHRTDDTRIPPLIGGGDNQVDKVSADIRVGKLDRPGPNRPRTEVPRSRQERWSGTDTFAKRSTPIFQ